MLYHTTPRHIRRLRAIKARMAKGPLPQYLLRRYSTELSRIQVLVTLDEQRKRNIAFIQVLGRIEDRLAQIGA